jgi:type I restriction enzyme S subunit
MRVSLYERYKKSGVHWLGDVPDHWHTKRLRRLFEIKKRIVGTVGFDVLSITQQGLKVKDTESNDGQISSDYSKYQLVERGDFAMNHMDLLTGYVDIARSSGVTSFFN